MSAPRPGAAGVLALVLAAAPAASVDSETPEPGLATAVKGADLQLLEEVRHVAVAVEALRGASFARLPLAVRVSDDLRRIAAEIRAGVVLERARLEARGRAWADVGLADEGAPRALLELLAADVTGIGFDPAGNRLLVASDRLTAGDFFPDDGAADDPSTVLMATGVRRDEPLVAHMLIHVLQRERAGRDTLEPTTDALLAAMAWAEGEANLLAVRYLFHGMDLADDVIDAGLDPGEVLDGSLISAELEARSGPLGELLGFVYLEGFARAAGQYRAGGWAALDRAAAERRTTRDVLHPDRPAAPAARFEQPEAPLAGATLADEDSLGEQAIVVLVSAHTGKDNLALLAAEGWQADRLYRWEAGGRGVTLWITRWDDEREAADFDYAYGRALDRRLGEARLEADAEGRRTGSAAGRRFRLERRGREVRLLVMPADQPAH